MFLPVSSTSKFVKKNSSQCLEIGRNTLPLPTSHMRCEEAFLVFARYIKLSKLAITMTS